MGFFRFRRSIRILPGVRINIGKQSTSVSVGVPGAHATLGGPTGTRTTVGLPGTGLSYTATNSPPNRMGRKIFWIVLVLAVAIAVLRSL